MHRSKLVALAAVLLIVATGCRLEAKDDDVTSGLLTKQDRQLTIPVTSLSANDLYWQKGQLDRTEWSEHIEPRYFKVLDCDADATTCPTTEGGTLALQRCERSAEVCSVRYTPPKGHLGTDTFRYNICKVIDNGQESKYCDDGTVTIGIGDAYLVAGTNFIPFYVGRTSRAELLDDDRLFVEGHETHIPVKPRTFTVDSRSKLGGQVTYDPATGAITYTKPAPAPGSRFHNDIDSFGYRVCHDGDAQEGTPCANGLATIPVYFDDGPPITTPTTAPATTTTTTTVVSTTTTTAAPADYDGDGVPDSTDNCPTTSNASQTDRYGTSAGDACELPDALQVTVNDNSFPNVNLEAYAYGPYDRVDFQLTSNDPDDVCTFFIDRDISFTRNGTEAGHPVDDGFIDDDTDTVDDNPDSLTFTEEGLTPGSTVYYRCEEHPLTMFGPIDIL